MLAVEIECLNAVVVVVSHENRLPMNRDTDGKFKLPVASTFLAPLCDETRWSDRLVGEQIRNHQTKENGDDSHGLSTFPRGVFRNGIAIIS